MLYKCPYDRMNCFAYNASFCYALQYTKDLKKEHPDACPFYKSDVQNIQDRQRAVARLKEIGREDLIGKYAHSSSREQKMMWGSET